MGTQAWFGPEQGPSAAGTADPFLKDVAALAAAQVAAGLSCGITLWHGDRPAMIASSDVRAAQVAAVQYELDDGPCVEAIRAGRHVVIHDATWDRRFSAFGRRATQLGVRSVLSVPLPADGTAGSLDLCAGPVATFGTAEIAQAERFARHAAGALLVVRQATLAGQLRAALSSRAIIDQAAGVIMGQNRCAPAAAFAILRKASQNRNVKLRQVAAEIIDSVSGQPPDPAILV
jgi:GAF domain-containing protein